eukprot:6045256-Pleurochrysis_carterae.AAC.2
MAHRSAAGYDSGYAPTQTEYQVACCSLLASCATLLPWEAAAVNHTELWRSIPGHLKPRFQYFNTAASADPASSDNPLNHILAIARQEDYVVLKLDIDHPELELAIIDQILVSPQLCAIIDELFWEHHVRRSPLQQTRVAFMGKSGIGWGEHVPARGQVAGTLASSHQIFASLRREGIRAHSAQDCNERAAIRSQKGRGRSQSRAPRDVRVRRVHESGRVEAEYSYLQHASGIAN